MIAIALMFAMTAVVSADSTSSTSTIKSSAKAELKAKMQERKAQASSTRQEFKAKLEEKKGEVCSALDSRIDARLSTFDGRFKAHTEVYDAHKAKLTQISVKLQAEGLDVSELNSDIAILEVKIDKFKADKAAVEAALNNTKNFACGESQGQFKDALKSLRDAQKIVVVDAKDIHDYIANTLKKDILALQAEYKAKHK